MLSYIGPSDILPMRDRYAGRENQHIFSACFFSEVDDLLALSFQSCGSDLGLYQIWEKIGQL